MTLIGSTYFGFAQNTIHDFQNTVLNSQWHCLRQMQQKRYKEWLVNMAQGLFEKRVKKYKSNKAEATERISTAYKPGRIDRKTIEKYKPKIAFLFSD